MELESVLVKEAGVVQTSFSCRMLDARGHQWLYFLVYLLTFLRSDASPDVPITIIHDAVKAGAVCLDGSPPAYHLDRGFGSGIKSWLVHMEGGGWCNDLATCLRRKTNRLGSSTVMERELRFTGILNHRGQSNPDFHNWNRVKIRYCDGSSFTGDVEEVYTTTNLHFRGARVWLAVMEDLLKQGLNNAENALLSGCSSAGLASMLHCDSFRALLPMGTKVKCLSDGGYFINAKDISGAPKIQNYFDEVVTLHGSAKNLPSSCTSRMQPGLCFFPQNIAGLIRTPLFILNSAIDSWQIRSILAPADNDPLGTWKACKTDIKNCSTNQLQIMQAFQAMDEMVGIRKFLRVLCKPRLDFLKALKPLSSAARGFFINSCYAHCQAELTETWLNNPSPLLDNTTIAKAVGDWFYDRRPFQEIGFPYPCDSTCVNFIYP